MHGNVLADLNGRQLGDNMNISWAFANSYQLDPTVTVDTIKNIGPAWGGWQTWRSCGTDNVISTDRKKNKDLISSGFQQNCNFYIPKDQYASLGRPQGVNIFNGDFLDTPPDPEDIIAMHLAGSTSELVLLVGYDFSPIIEEDVMERHNRTNYMGLARSAIANNSETQWVLIDSPTETTEAFSKLENFTSDTLGNVLNMLT